MAAGEKWCPQTPGDVLTALLTDSPNKAAVRQQAARVAKVQLKEPDPRSHRETWVLGARPMSPDGAHSARETENSSDCPGFERRFIRSEVDYWLRTRNKS